jgi:hypothetical protein
MHQEEQQVRAVQQKKLTKILPFCHLPTGALILTKIILSVFIGLDIIPAKFCTSTTPPSVNLTLKTKTNQSKETPKDREG